MLSFLKQTIQILKRIGAWLIQKLAFVLYREKIQHENATSKHRLWKTWVDDIQIHPERGDEVKLIWSNHYHRILRKNIFQVSFSTI
jgi:hypothetical protein